MYAKKQTSACAASSAVEREVFQNSCLARAGNKCIQIAMYIRLSQHALVLLMMVGLMVLAMVSPIAAQQGGANLGGNSSNPINAFRTALDIGVWALLGLGIAGIGWGIYNVMFGNAWQRQMIGGGAALGFAGIVALINDVINDTPPALPTY